MVLPATGDVSAAHDLVRRLGSFLDDLTAGRSAHAVHLRIVEAAGEQDQRVANVQRDPAGFAVIWEGLITGSAVPATAWERAVLPAVVAFSNQQNRKAHLELATSYWLAAREAAEILAKVQPPGTMPDGELASHEEITISLGARTLAGLAPAQVITTGRLDDGVQARRRRLRRTKIVAVITVLLVVTAILLWWLAERPTGQKPAAAMTTVLPGQSAATPAGTAATQPAVNAMATGSPRPAETHPAPMRMPAPTPTWTSPGPSAPPTAPRDLMAAEITSTAVTLTWQPPADAGSGGITYYRIQSNGQDAGWTKQTTVTVTGLTPETSYTFTVTARNGAGLSSPASDPLTVTTSAPPASTPPPSPTPAISAPSSSDT